LSCVSAFNVKEIEGGKIKEISAGENGTKMFALGRKISNDKPAS